MVKLYISRLAEEHLTYDKVMKKVSIIVPVYKSENFIRKLIDSVLNQTYKNIELILVDDESPDSSGKICDEYAKQDNRIVVIHQKNAGCCGARNTGLKAVTGEYLMFADGDDWLETDCVEYLVGLMEKNGCEMATTDSIFTTRDRGQNPTENVRILSKEDAICEILYTKIPLGPWNKIYTTKIIKEHQLDFSIPWFGEGLYFSTLAAQYSNQLAVGHRRVYNYRLNNPNSGLTVREVKNAINAVYNIKNIKDKLIIRTRKTLCASDWHICYNYYFLMCYIIWAKSSEQYKSLYRETYAEMLRLAPKVIVHAKVKLWKKIYILVACIMPKLLAHIVLKRKTKCFKADKMN